MPMLRFRGSLAAGVLAAIGASVCCVGPLVVMMLGIGDAWVANLTALELLRPWFNLPGAGLAALVPPAASLRARSGVRRAGRPQAATADFLDRRRAAPRIVVGAPAGTALPPKGLLMRQSIVSLLLAAISPAASLAATPQTAVLDVQNMTCELCPVTVRKSLEKVQGVSQARIDFAKKTATVMFDADKTNVATLVKATTEAGYPSKVRK
jgi:mercuric ion binding protein